MLRRFLSYVEITTKITSTMPFLLTLAFIIVLGGRINIGLSALFFAAMFLFDLTTTAINNYIDTKDNHQTLQFKRKTAFIIAVTLLAVSSVLGTALALMTDEVVFILGVISFAFGIFYTFGPIPISRQPVGEIFSGLFYGLVIPFILLYINMPEGYFISTLLTAESFMVEIRFAPLLSVLLFSVAPFFATSNIMLANNTCDLEHDIKVKRYTLPYYIGKKNAVRLFIILYCLIYLSGIMLVVFSVAPPLYLISLLTAPLVFKNTAVFEREQIKEKTFIVSIKNFVLVIGGNIIAMFLCAILK